MTRYEYKVVPAPVKGRKAKGVKTPEARFALSVEDVLNNMGTEGWEYLRAELLPSEERSGLTGSTKNWRNVLVFRRALEVEVARARPEPETAREESALPATPALSVVPATQVATSDNVPPVGPATQFEDPPSPEPEPKPETAEVEETVESDLDRLFEPEPEQEKTFVMRSEPVEDPPAPAEPERRTPPNLTEIGAPPVSSAATPEAAPELEWEDENDTSLSGIERVVRRTAAEQRESSEET